MSDYLGFLCSGKPALPVTLDSKSYHKPKPQNVKCVPVLPEPMT